MVNIVIKKRVSLSSLGEEYKEAYLEFKAMPVSEYETVIPKLDGIESRVDNTKAVVDLLKEKFLSGEFPVDGKLTALSKDDLGQFDEATLAHCLAVITGQVTDPKS